MPEPRAQLLVDHVDTRAQCSRGFGCYGHGRDLRIAEAVDMPELEQVLIFDAECPQGADQVTQVVVGRRPELERAGEFLE